MLITEATEFKFLPQRTYIVVVDGETTFERYKMDGTLVAIPDSPIEDGGHRRMNTISKGNVIVATPVGASSVVQMVQLQE